jgi:hypothetical protein
MWLQDHLAAYFARTSDVAVLRPRVTPLPARALPGRSDDQRAALAPMVERFRLVEETRQQA